MAVTTKLDLDNYISSSRKIISQFARTYIASCDITLDAPDLGRDLPLSKPLIVISGVGGGYTQSLGAGRRGVGRFAIRKTLTFVIDVICDDATGGEMMRDTISGKLEMAFFKHGSVLQASGLRKPSLSPPSPLRFPKDIKLIGNSHVFTCWVELSYSG